MVRIIVEIIVKRLTQVEVRNLNRTLKANSFNNYRRLLLSVLQDYSSMEPYSSMIGFIRSKRYDLLFRAADSLSAQTHADATSHLVANQIASLIRKYPWDSSAVLLDPELKARETFLRSEHRCRRFNAIFRAYDNKRSPHGLLLSRARQFIAYVLGHVPDYEMIYQMCDFGPGASLGLHGDATSFGRKISHPELSVSPGAYIDAIHAWWSNEQLRDRFLEKKLYGPTHEISCLDPSSFSKEMKSKMRLVQHNKLSFVPKTAKTHRAIAVEPLLNTFLQKGLDQDLRSKLLRIGIDLQDQSLNCRMAREGSIDNSEDGYCTIDLSSASDSISIGLVKYLLPPAWFDIMNRWRSPSYEFSPGDVRPYEKFCSMGNGFCFPLQTLIFCSLAHASGAGEAGVDFRAYGDDIIVRRSAFAQVCKLLKICGFQTNPQKTFSDGPFRESCGSDWYYGEDVRPYTLDHKLDSVENVFKFLNLSRRSNRTAFITSSGFETIFNLLPDSFHVFMRPYNGPANTGIDPIDPHICPTRALGRSKRTIWWTRWAELSMRPVKDMHEVPNWGVYAAALRGHVSEHVSQSHKDRVDEFSKCLFTYRRRTKTSIRYFAYSGNWSNWLPA
jgi:hypothetical protein